MSSGDSDGCGSILLNRARVHDVLSDAGVDVIVGTSPENVYYTSGHYCLAHWVLKGTLSFSVLPTEVQAASTVISPAIGVDAWAEDPGSAKVRLCGVSSQEMGRNVRIDQDLLVDEDLLIWQAGFRDGSHPSAGEVLRDVIIEASLGDARIALDESGLTYSTRAHIMRMLPEARFEDGEELMQRIRMVKTDAEVERLTAAAEMCCSALADTMHLAQPGITERDLVTFYETRIASTGGRPSFTTIAGGRRSAHPHPLVSDYTLKSGDVVKYDLGGTRALYHSDVGRTQAIAAAGKEEQRIFEALAIGQRAGIAMLRPGIRPSEVFATVLDEIRANGVPKYQRQHVGHGIGIELYDQPLIQPAGESGISKKGPMDEPLEVGMVVNVETPYYCLGEFGMQIEDTVIVTREGPRCITDLERRLL